MPANPFKDAIRDLIEASPSGLSEYDLMQGLQQQDPEFAFEDDSSSLALFRQHFLVMNALYRLQAELFEEERYLAISPLAIRLEPRQDPGPSALPTDSADAPLREYYLDWDNLSQTTHEEVDSMLNRFWERYLAIDKRVAALQTLELPADASWEAVKQAYRRLAARHHPDKGGESARFRDIRGAYEVLMRCYTT
ncbi:MAG: DNA-J related domain-containing protein [Pseudomonadota bacterium]